MIKLFIVAGLTSVVIVSAQEAKVVVSNHPSRPVVQVKYYVPQLYFDEGVNVYRRQPGTADWIKLNSAPLKKGTKPSQQELNQDKELQAYIHLMDSASHDQVQGLVLLTVLIKSFTHESFSRYLGILHEDGTAQRGATYEYRVSKVQRNADEELGISSPIVAGVYLSIDPPAEVLVKEGKKGEYKAMFAWKPESERYYGVNVYRKVQGVAGEKRITKNPVMLSKVSNAQGNKGYPEIMFEDDSLQAGRAYEYQLAAVDFFGRESRRSTAHKIEIKDSTPTPAPEKLSSEIDHHQMQVSLNWKKVTATDLAGYYIYRGRKSEGPYQRVNNVLLPADKTQYADRVPQTRGYYYYVAAVDKAGNEANSDPVFAEVKDVVPPSAPKNVIAKADTGMVALTWEVSTEPDVIGYQVFRTVNTNSKERFVLLNATAISEARFEDKLSRNVKNKFLYRVVAVDSAHNKSEPSAVAITRLPDVTPPAPPFIKLVSASSNALVVEWMPLIDRDARSIRVLRSANAEVSTVATVAPGTVRYEDNQAEPGIRYEYFLTAADSSGNVSGKSNSYTASLIQSKSITTINDVNTNYDSLKKSVTISWPALPGMQGFVVYRKEGKDQFRPLTGLIEVTQFADGSVSKGKTYIYRVKAFDATGMKAESGEYKIEIR